MAKVTILKIPKAKDGASLIPIGDGTSLFKGPSHEKGGIPFSYGGKRVEVEGQETLQEGPDGADIMGGMKVPGTNKTFATVSKLLAKKEQKTKDKMQKGADLVKAANPDDRWEILKFNTGRAYMSGGAKKLQEIQQNKEHLTTLQRVMLEHSDEMGIDPNKFSKGVYSKADGEYMEKAKYGKHIPKAQAGINLLDSVDPEFKSAFLKMISEAPDYVKNGVSISGGYRTPEHQKFLYEEGLKKWGPGKISGKVATPGHSAHEFKLASDLQFLNPQAKKWIYDNSSKYDIDFPLKSTDPNHAVYVKNLKNRKWTGPNSIIGRNKGPEDVSTYPPINVGNVTAPTTFDEINTPSPNRVTPGKYNFKFTNPKPIDAPSNTEPLELQQVLPELYTAATNKEEPVWLQQYKPQLYQPYNVSFQDRLNEQKAQFKEVQKIAGNNPAALATLAGQEYGASSSVLGEEFRTNQAIANDVTNKNIALLNDAQNENLKLADQQYVRQSTAKSNTKAQNFNVLSSISDKLLQRESENRALKVYENLYPNYRFDKNTGAAQYYGPNADEQINFGGGTQTPGIQPIGKYSTSTKRYDGLNKYKGMSIRTPSEEDITKKQLNEYKDYLPKKKYGGSLVRKVNSFKKNASSTMMNTDFTKTNL